MATSSLAAKLVASSIDTSTRNTVHVFLNGKELSFRTDKMVETFDLSEGQLSAIRLAVRSLGVVLEDSKIHQFSTIERLTFPLIYVMLERVGYDVKSYWGFSPSEADISLLYFNYPDFDMLLILGNILTMMSDEEHIQLKKTISETENWLSSDATCWEMIEFKCDNGKLLARNLDNFLEWLDQSKCSSYRKYIDEFRKRHSKVSADARQRELLHRAIEKGMEEGYISLKIIKMVICGPPCVGKTAFKDLLANRPPPFSHHSTPIAARPVRAIEQIAAGGKVWKDITEEDLLQLLTDIIRNAEMKSQAITSTTKDSISAISQESPQPITSESSSKHKPLTSSTTNSDSLLYDEVDSLSLSKADSPSLSNDDEADSLSLYDDEADSLSLSINDSLLIDKDEPVSLPHLNFDILSKDLIKHFSSPNRRKGSQMLHEATWIHLLDSGGQPQFTDLLRMFVRGNSLYIIVMKVTESLHDKPTFVYSIDGKPVTASKKMTMTNLQIIESFVRSVAATSREDNSEPAFAIVATHWDKQSYFKQFFGLEETIIKKNETLLSCLSEFRNLFVFYNRDSNELIFPVDNLCQWNREKISADIRHRLVSSQSDIRGNINIPVRWYVFDLHMKEEALKETHGMISLESCYNIGHKLGMKKTDVDKCLVYLDSMRLCIYYPKLLPHVVFTNPQFLIDSLSNIACVSFVDDLAEIGINLSHEDIESLNRDGVFDESLLDSLQLDLVPGLFSKEDFLSLLQHFLVISTIKTADGSPQYFIPILLPAERLNEEQKALFAQVADPLLIPFDKIVLQVKK